MRRDDALLLDMLTAAKSIVEFIGDMDRTEFREDGKTQSAVQHQILVLGEASKRVTDTFRNAHTEIPWRQISKMRDKLIHHYEAADLEQIYNTSTREIPELVRILEPLVPKPTDDQA